MNAPFSTRMTSDQFLEWEERQERKHELVDGVIRLMAGASAAHNRIAANVLVALKTRLRGRPCEPFGSDMKVRIPNGNFRYPDLTVDCGRPKNRDVTAAEPRVIVEVLSPSTEWFDQTKKLEDYQSVPSILEIAFMAQDRAFARVWTRSGENWASEEIDGLEGALCFASIETEISLTEAYDGVEFDGEENTDA
jgi:Uma2 family endonuclease